jgi:hypothetical protein
LPEWAAVAARVVAREPVQELDQVQELGLDQAQGLDQVLAVLVAWAAVLAEAPSIQPSSQTTRLSLQPSQVCI